MAAMLLDRMGWFGMNNKSLTCDSFSPLVAKSRGRDNVVCFKAGAARK